MADPVSSLGTCPLSTQGHSSQQRSQFPPWGHFSPKVTVPTRGRSCHQRSGFTPEVRVPTRGHTSHQRSQIPPEITVPTRCHSSHPGVTVLIRGYSSHQESWFPSEVMVLTRGHISNPQSQCPPGVTVPTRGHGLHPGVAVLTQDVMVPTQGQFLGSTWLPTSRHESRHLSTSLVTRKPGPWTNPRLTLGEMLDKQPASGRTMQRCILYVRGSQRPERRCLWRLPMHQHPPQLPPHVHVLSPRSLGSPPQ